MMGRRAQSKRLQIKKLTDLSINQQYYLRSFLPPMLEIAAPYVIKKWIETFDVFSYAASVCRNWKWLDAQLVNLLLPYPQDRCVDACFYMYETSLRVTTFKNIKKEKLENVAVLFDVYIPDNESITNNVEIVRLKESPRPTQSEFENALSILIFYASSTKDLSDYLNEHIDDLGTKYKVAAFLVPCHCGGPTTYNMDRLIRLYSGLSNKLRQDFMERQFKWRFWLVHYHQKSLLNINDPINWAYGECVATLKESELSEESLN